MEEMITLSEKTFKAFKEQIREKHLEWLEEELDKIDFGEEYSQEKLIFAMGRLVLELCGHKRTYRRSDS